MIEIDGSYGEGGGSIIRTAIGLSAATGKAVRVFRIRKGRTQPGLKEQHLQGIRAVSDFCNGKLRGAELGSSEITFEPGKEFSDKVRIRIETAGSVGLALQPVMIAATAAKKEVKVEINGGATYGKWAPPIDFVEGVFSKILGKMGYATEFEIKRHGFYPTGGAKVEVILKPPDGLKGLNLVEQGKIENTKGISVASEHLQKQKVAERQKISARQEIFKQLKVSSNIKTAYLKTESTGSAITICLTTQKGGILGSSQIGEKNLRAEIVGKQAAQSLISDFQGGATIDRHSLDQIIPFLLLSQFNSSLKFSELTTHALSNIHVAEQFFSKKLKISEKMLFKQ
ncbi:TPA: RNA 3'-terminal phosphate cyclase [archaeon]|nr:RNA 3'-terminal phosphate cyclase [Candidatus Naiadarchaeales archaeon SRR2090153.bin461]